METQSHLRSTARCLLSICNESCPLCLSKERRYSTGTCRQPSMGGLSTGLPTLPPGGFEDPFHEDWKLALQLECSMHVTEIDSCSDLSREEQAIGAGHRFPAFVSACLAETWPESSEEPSARLKTVHPRNKLRLYTSEFRPMPTFNFALGGPRLPQTQLYPSQGAPPPPTPTPHCRPSYGLLPRTAQAAGPAAAPQHGLSGRTLRR